MNKLELLAHPIRLRIVGAFSGREITLEDARHSLSDIPQASLYRHVQILVDAGILTVVSCLRARGGARRVLTVLQGNALIPTKELRLAQGASLETVFVSFIAALQANVRTFVGLPRRDPTAEGIACRGETFFITDAEARGVRSAVHDELARVANKGPLPGSRRWRASFVMLPLEPHEESI